MSQSNRPGPMHESAEVFMAGLRHANGTASAPKRRCVKAEVKLVLDVCDECGVSSSARLYALGLYGFTCALGRCWPGTDAIAQKTGLAERTQRKVRDELIVAGILRVVKPATRANGVRGQWAIIGKTLPRGRWISYLWPIASDAGKRECARMLMPKAARANEHTQWFMQERGWEGKRGPYTEDWIIAAIKSGRVEAGQMLSAEGIGVVSAAGVPAFAALFKLAG